MGRYGVLEHRVRVQRKEVEARSQGAKVQPVSTLAHHTIWSNLSSPSGLERRKSSRIGVSQLGTSPALRLPCTRLHT